MERAPKHPEVMVACAKWGVLSETWLPRQVRAIRGFDLSVVCWQRDFGWEEPEHRFLKVRVMGARLRPDRLERAWDRFRRRGFKSRIRLSRDAELELSAQLQERPSAVIWAHFGPMALRLLPVAEQHSIPLVPHFHGHDWSEALRSRAYRSALAHALPRFAAILVDGAHMHDWFVRRGVDPGHVVVAPAGACVSEAPEAAARTEQPCRFIAVGRFVEKKGPLQTIEAFSRVLANAPGATLTIIGEGPLLARAQRLGRRLRLNGNLRLLGPQPPASVRHHLARASVFVQHSLTAQCGDMEGRPNSIAEAAAAGLPVVATRHADIGRQVIENETGFLVVERDVDAMADRMACLAADPQMRLRFGRAARAFAQQTMDVACSARAIELCFRRVLEGVDAPHAHELAPAVQRALAIGQAYRSDSPGRR